MELSRRPLGSTGIEVSVLGWGTVKVGRNSQVKNKSADGFPLPSIETVSELLGICRESGLNLIDLAPAYGTAEERIGSLLGGDRPHFVLSTKVGEEFDGQSSTYDFSPAAIRESVDRSLRRLRTDYLDIVLLHLPREDLRTMRESDALDTLARLKRAGLIRAFGASTHTVEGGLYALEAADVVMVPFNPGYAEHQPVIERAATLEKGITIKRGLQSGHLPPGDPDQALRSCLRFSLGHRAVASLIAGTIHPDHLRQNIDAANAVLAAG